MRAFEIDRQGHGRVADISEPRATSGQAIVSVARVGICGTDLGLYNGDETRITRARTTYPIRPGHEWAGTVTAVGDDADRQWIGRRVTGHTMIGCGLCDDCAAGQIHLCQDRFEVGVRGGWDGALAERFVMPVASLLQLPDNVHWDAAAMVEPGGNAQRSVVAAGAAPGAHILVIGAGTIGLLSALFARATGAEVHLLGRRESSLVIARQLGLPSSSSTDQLPDVRWDAVIDSSNGPTVPAEGAELVRPGGRLVLVGVSETPSELDTRRLVHREVTAIGILGGSAGLQPAIDAYASGVVDPLPLVGRTVALEQLDALFSSGMRVADGVGPKTLVDPTLSNNLLP